MLRMFQWLNKACHHTHAPQFIESFVLISCAVVFFSLGAHTSPVFIVLVSVLATAYLLVLFIVRSSHILMYKIVILSLLVLCMLVVPLFIQIYDRQFAPEYALTYHDGALQSEIAFSFFQEAKNPYSETYYNTELGQNEVYRFFMGTNILNPALEHYVYLPGTFLLGGLASLAENVLFGFSDERFLYLFVFVASTALLYNLLYAYRFGFVALLLFALNPWTIHFLIQGRNDILPIFFITMTAWLLLKKRFLWAGLAFGLALTVKQFTWILFPLIILYLYLRHQTKTTPIGRPVFLVGIPALLVAALVITPFFLWQPNAFIDDIILYASGSSSGLRYPINGIGFSRLFTLLGFDPFASFPFWAIMIPVGCIAAYLAIRYILLKNRLSSVLLSYAGLMFAIFVFARFFNDNHFFYIVDIAIVAIAARANELTATRHAGQISKSDHLQS